MYNIKCIDCGTEHVAEKFKQLECAKCSKVFIEEVNGVINIYACISKS